MRFACTYPIISHPANPDLLTGSAVAAVAEALEAAGFGALGFTDHPAPPQRWLEGGGHDSLDPFSAMAFAAARTSTLRLIPNIVVLPYHSPFTVAKQGATLDLLSDGRFTLAVGVGYLKREFGALGIDFDTRAERFDESLKVIRTLWTSDDVTVEGRHFNAKGITAHPRPVSRPHPPIWIGGNTGAARQRVAEHGNGWAPFAAPPGLAKAAGTAAMDTLEALIAGIADLRSRFEAIGRDFTDIDVSFTNLAGGSIGQPDFDAEAYLAGVAELAAAGVTWIQVPLPGENLSRLLDGIASFGELVIEPLGAQ